MRLLRSLRADQTYGGSLDREYPQAAPSPYSEWGRLPDGEDEEPAPRRRRRPAAPRKRPPPEGRPSLPRRFGRSLADTRRRVLPLPDEVIDQFLGNGERMIHNDHPSFRSFMVENSLLFAGFLLLAVMFLAISFNGSLVAGLGILLLLSLVLLALVLKRLEDRYTSYVITDARFMRISGIISRRAHSIPWVRVTDLTIDQSLTGRLFGYATLHIESANEDSGLRDLEGVSDPVLFNQYITDMVIAKQGTAEPEWAKRGEPPPVAMSTGLRRIRMSRRRRAEEGEEDGPAGPAGAAPGVQPAGRRRPPRGRAPEEAAPMSEAEEAEEIEEMAAESLAARLRSSGEADNLPWRRR